MRRRPGEGIIGKPDGGLPPQLETCPVCGQSFDPRVLANVLHHAEPKHAPARLDCGKWLARYRDQLSARLTDATEIEISQFAAVEAYDDLVDEYPNLLRRWKAQWWDQARGAGSVRTANFFCDAVRLRFGRKHD